MIGLLGGQDTFIDKILKAIMNAILTVAKLLVTFALSNEFITIGVWFLVLNIIAIILM